VFIVMGMQKVDANSLQVSKLNETGQQQDGLFRTANIAAPKTTNSSNRTRPWGYSEKCFWE
jgi:hypothetical protein